MILRGYGIELSRLRHSDIELVRQMRNADHVRRYMEFRETITPEMQEKWFASIDNAQNNFYLVAENGKTSGLIYGAQIDWEKHETGNGGLFIWEEALWGTMLPLAASFLLTDLTFIMGIARVYIKVLRDNARAATFVKQAGYTLLPGQENVENQQYVLTEKAYEEKTAKLRDLLRRRHPGPHTCDIDNPEHPANKMVIEQYCRQPAAKKEQLVMRVHGTIIA